MIDAIVYKYELEPGYNCLQLPVGAQALTAQMQRGEIQLWTLNPSLSKSLVNRVFMVHGTGWPIDGDSGRYIATAQSPSGDYVWHVFEVLS